MTALTGAGTIPSGGAFTAAVFKSKRGAAILTGTPGIAVSVTHGKRGAGVVPSGAGLSAFATSQPAPITGGLTALPNTQAGTVLLSWTNPPTVMGIKIEGLDPATGVWETQYNDALVSSRHVYPTPTQSWDWRVSTTNASSVSTPVMANNVVLGPHGSMGMVIWLTSTVDPTLIVPLGAYDNDDAAINWLAVRDEKFLLAMGQTDLDRVRSVQTTYIADQMDWILPPYTFEDGTRLHPFTYVQRLQKMWAGGHLLQYRDFRGQIYYCFISQPRARLFQNVASRVSFTLTSTAPPAFPLTS